MKLTLLKVILLLAAPLTITSCVPGVDMHGDWWNNNYAPEKQKWSLQGNNQSDFDRIWNSCEKSATEKINNFDAEMRDELIKDGVKQLNIGINQYKFERCLISNGFKFHPTGIKNNYANSCIGDAKDRPGCQSVR